MKKHNSPKKSSLKTRPQLKKRTKQELKQEKPHRSFRLSRRRDYYRRHQLPGYFKFAGMVFSTLNKHRFTFVALGLLFGLLGILFGSMTAQDTYRQISELLGEGSAEVFNGGLGSITQAALLAVASFTGGQGLTEGQQVYLVMIFLLTWLSTVWLLREYQAGRSPSLRDGLYNSAAPLLPTFFVGLVMMIQLIPFGIMLIARSALGAVGIELIGFGGMIFYLLMIAVSVLTLYWITSTFFALIIVTLPGIYPMQALKSAKKIVTGRRLVILYRMLWAIMMVAVVWLVTIVPLILLTNWLGNLAEWLNSVPIVPLYVVFLSAATTIWLCSYVYLFYRKVVEDDIS